VQYDDDSAQDGSIQSAAIIFASSSPGSARTRGELCSTGVEPVAWGEPMGATALVQRVMTTRVYSDNHA
jgi:hypothetical protein